MQCYVKKISVFCLNAKQESRTKRDESEFCDVPDSYESKDLENERETADEIEERLTESTMQQLMAPTELGTKTSSFYIVCE